MKLIILSILIISYITFSEAVVQNKAVCALELITNSVKCIKKCRNEKKCTKLMDHCKKIKRPLLRSICKGILKCTCPTCLLCVAKCIVYKFMKHNICNVGIYLKGILTLLGVHTYFDMSQKKGQEDAMKAVLDKVVKKNTSNSNDEDEEEEFDDEEASDDENDEENEDEENEEEKEEEKEEEEKDSKESVSKKPPTTVSPKKSDDDKKVPLAQAEDDDYYYDDEYDEK